jgi:hypothetical protein
LLAISITTYIHLILTCGLKSLQNSRNTVIKADKEFTGTFAGGKKKNGKKLGKGRRSIQLVIDTISVADPKFNPAITPQSLHAFPQLVTIYLQNFDKDYVNLPGELVVNCVAVVAAPFAHAVPVTSGVIFLNMPPPTIVSDKSRQGSGGKSFFGRKLHKDRIGDDASSVSSSNLEPTGYPASTVGSRSSKHSKRTSVSSLALSHLSRSRACRPKPRPPFRSTTYPRSNKPFVENLLPTIWPKLVEISINIRPLTQSRLRMDSPITVT